MFISRKKPLSKEYRKNPNSGPDIGVDSPAAELLEIREELSRHQKHYEEFSASKNVKDAESMISFIEAYEEMAKPLQLRKLELGDKFYRNEVKDIGYEFSLEVYPTRSKEKFPRLPYIELSKRVPFRQWGKFVGIRVPDGAWNYGLFEVGSGLYIFAEIYGEDSYCTEGEFKLPIGTSKFDFFASILCQFLILGGIELDIFDGKEFDWKFLRDRSSDVPFLWKKIEPTKLSCHPNLKIVDDGLIIELLAKGKWSTIGYLTGAHHTPWDELDSFFKWILRGFKKMPLKKRRRLTKIYNEVLSAESMPFESASDLKTTS